MIANRDEIGTENAGGGRRQHAADRFQSGFGSDDNGSREPILSLLEDRLFLQITAHCRAMVIGLL